MHEVEIETAYGPGRRSGTADVPLFGDPDDTLSGGSGQLECRDDQRILAGVAEMSGQPARVVGYPVPAGVEVAADEPDPRSSHARYDLADLLEAVDSLAV
jgi:hypothetical protein